ncbi:glycosyltransferase family 4 protein [Mycoplasmatota bacterium WC30]
MKKILIMTNSDTGLYLFRRELIEILSQIYEIHVSVPRGKYRNDLQGIGCIMHDILINRRGTNPIKELLLFLHYIRLIRNIKPDLILTYTIKPNIYGGFASKITKTPFIVNITGLGSSFKKKGLLRIIVSKLYKNSLINSDMIFFQNKNDKDVLINLGVSEKNAKILPGSGVNLEHFIYQEYPDNKTINFLFIGRIMREKGIDLYLKASKKIKNIYPNTMFHIVGEFEEDYRTIMAEYINEKYIKYHGNVDEVRNYYKFAHAIVLPTFHEGMSNVLLESAASGRPVIASKIPGCEETFDENISGYGFEMNKQQELELTLEKFIKLPYQEKIKMGLRGRKKISREFDRKLVVNAYIKSIADILGNV